jgi:hypothetical protein
VSGKPIEIAVAQGDLADILAAAQAGRLGL